MTNLYSNSPAGGRRSALLIAVQDNLVDEFPKLIHPHRDAKELQHFLIKSFGYNVKLMMDDKSIPMELWPTRANIVSTLDSHKSQIYLFLREFGTKQEQIELFVHDVSAGDRLFFYYSGHGYQVPCRHHTEPDGLDEEIYSCDGKEIIDNDLKKWLVDPLPRGCKLFALWDSCHSATILDLDHYDCNSPRIEQRVREFRDSIPLPTLLQALPHFLRKDCTPPLPKSAFTIACHELRGRPASRASVNNAGSAGNSPPRPFPWFIPFTEGSRLVLSPPPWPICNGKCPLPAECDVEYAHVISLSACKDNEMAVDDRYNGTFTTFFMEHLRENPVSTLRELLLAIRKRVDEITTARREWDKVTQVISRQSTFSNSPRTKPKRPIRRPIVIGVSVDEYLQLPPPKARKENENQYSQKPSIVFQPLSIEPR